MAAEPYRFLEAELHPAQRMLRVGGQDCQVGARAFDVLLALERRDRVVSKNELIDLVWPMLVVEENNLLVHIGGAAQAARAASDRHHSRAWLSLRAPVDAVNDGGMVETAPTPVAIRGNLPASPPLFGRAQDLDAVDALLREHAVVTMSGWWLRQDAFRAGAAAMAARSSRRMDAGGLNLRASTRARRSRAASRERSRMQLPGGGRRRKRLPWHCGRNGSLLVLDNCEHVIDAAIESIEAMLAGGPGFCGCLRPAVRRWA